MTHEVETSPEVARNDYDQLIAAVANHESKALTLAYMASRGPGQYFSAEQIGTDIVSIQGPEPAWKQSLTTAFTYCEESFEPIAAVAKSRLEVAGGKSRTVYEVTPFGAQEAFALTGFVLDWSLKYPDISVQSLLGATQSRTDNRSPLHRLAMLESILTSGDGEISLGQIAADHPELPGIGTILETVKTSSFSKVVDVASNQNGYNPTLNILDTEYRGKHSYDTLSNERKAVYDALHEIGVNQGDSTVTLGDFIDTVLTLHPDLDARKVRALLMQAIGPNRSGLPGLKIAEDGRGELGSNKSSKISIKPQYHDAVADFVNGLHAFTSGDNHESARIRAREIVEDPESCYALMEKAFENSNKARAARAAIPMAEAVFQLLQQSEKPLSVPEIVSGIENGYKISLGRNAIRNHLQKLVKSDRVSKAELTVVEQGRAQKLSYYSTKQA